ncbi:FlgB family protein [Yoonia vestfoldensis]|uniref:FlgB family protein n=1 Tax=Yoonia vestfoldensis TaxID=245188 RepID=UPI0003734D95|nr:FlgB family protein [Yoonia vestfoldensis]
MYQSLELFQTAGAMARHAGARQAVVTRNIANADTPGYHAQEIAPFRDVYGSNPAPTLRQTRPGHQAPDVTPIAARPVAGRSEPSPNGNNVSLEDEMLASVAVAREHSRALAIYRHGMTILRTTLGRG